MSDDSARLQTDLVRLVDQGRRPDKTLVPRAPATAIPASAGAGRPSQATGAGTAGIASPLTEPDAATRQYHANAAAITTDGVFTWVIKPIKQVDMRDAGNAVVALIFADPYAAP